MDAMKPTWAPLGEIPDVPELCLVSVLDSYSPPVREEVIALLLASVLLMPDYHTCFRSV